VQAEPAALRQGAMARIEVYFPRAGLIRRLLPALRAGFGQSWLKKISWRFRSLEFRILPPLP
jgi:hypothetical protein